MKKKEKIWKELGIECEFIFPEEIRRKTLLKDNSDLHVLRITQDGKFHPDSMQRIILHLQTNYPQHFRTYVAHVKELHLDKVTSCPLSVSEQLSDGQNREVDIQTFFGSLGHNQVFKESDTSFLKHSPWLEMPVFGVGSLGHHWVLNESISSIKQKPLWLEIPVSGNSTVWKCTIDKQELLERFGQKSSNEEQFARDIRGLLPSANLCNLHLTTWDGEISETKVTFYARASQGANFNSWVANKNDLRNIWANLDRFFIGDWELISAGTCTRKTHISNVPEYVELSSDPERPATFLHGLSGIGFSFSGV